MKFGICMAPFHEVGRNPTYSLERDMQLIQWLLEQLATGGAETSGGEPK